MKLSKKEKEMLSDLLPHDFDCKFIEHEFMFNLYKITYTYKTIRGNNKENNKYLIADNVEDAKFKFIEHINHFNNINKHRPVLNVKILNTVNIGTIKR